MILKDFHTKLMFTLFLTVCNMASAIAIKEPEDIKLSTLAIADGINKSALIKWNGFDIYTQPGNKIGTDLLVHDINTDSIVLNRPSSRKFYIIKTQFPTSASAEDSFIASDETEIWKIIKTAALAYKKDYICNCQTNSFKSVSSHARSMDKMLKAIADPNHRFCVRDDIIYFAPVHVDKKSWKQLRKAQKSFKSAGLCRNFPNLKRIGSLISDGKQFEDQIRYIKFKTGVNIYCNKTQYVPLYCSLRDRPWHEILASIVYFNGLRIVEVNGGIEIRE